MKHNTIEILQSITKRVICDLASRPILNYSLLGGDFGEVIYLYCASKYGLCNVEVADSYLDIILSSIIRHRPIISTYCNGLAGLCIGLNWLEKSGYIEGASKSFTVYDNLLSDKLYQMLDSNLDFLHGAIGIGLYFVMRASDDLSAYLQVKNILHYLDTNVLVKNDGMCLYWRYPNRYGVLEENLSISHGISSTAIFLIRAYKIFNDEDRIVCRRLLKGIAEYLKSYIKDSSKLGFYTPMPSTGSKSRLGWCYGDIGTSIALRAIGETLKEEDLLNISCDIAIHTALYRNNLKSDYVYDACQCHGAAGVAHFFKNCRDYFHESLYDKAFAKWKYITLQMYGYFDGEYMFGNFRYDDMKIHKSLSLLEGDTGVALMLMGEHKLIDNFLLYEY